MSLPYWSTPPHSLIHSTNRCLNVLVSFLVDLSPDSPLLLVWLLKGYGLFRLVNGHQLPTGIFLVVGFLNRIFYCFSRGTIRNLKADICTFFPPPWGPLHWVFFWDSAYWEFAERNALWATWSKNAAEMWMRGPSFAWPFLFPSRATHFMLCPHFVFAAASFQPMCTFL